MRSLQFLTQQHNNHGGDLYWNSVLFVSFYLFIYLTVLCRYDVASRYVHNVIVMFLTFLRFRSRSFTPVVTAAHELKIIPGWLGGNASKIPAFLKKRNAFEWPNLPYTYFWTLFSCLPGFLAPDKIDNKFFDPKHAFKEVEVQVKTVKELTTSKKPKVSD